MTNKNKEIFINLGDPAVIGPDLCVYLANMHMYVDVMYKYLNIIFRYTFVHVLPLFY